MFAVKGGRFITHMKRLSGVEAPLANFFASGVLALDTKLGPFLWQLPENLSFDADLVEGFLAQLPRTSTEAGGLADTAGRWPFIDERTSDFEYVRLHGDAELYASGYSASALDRWADRCRSWLDDGRDVFVYFDNDSKGYAPHDAQELISRLP